MEFATKPIQHYPRHLRYVATLPRKINNSNFLQIFSRYGRKCKQITFLNYPLLTFVCQPFCCLPLQIQTSYQNLVLVTEYHVDC